MNGAVIYPTRPPRRRKVKPSQEHSSIEIHGCPTKERLRMAGDDFALGGEDRGVKTYTMRDCPLDRAFKKRIISGAEHSALQKYRHHWYHAGLSPGVGSADLNRVFSSDPSSISGMAKSERQVFHRLRYREAVDEIGIRGSFIVEHVVCYEHALHEAGLRLGWSSPYRAREGARVGLVEAAVKLAKIWGIG
jgi:hypothetical protein